jgi:hypothetical protein
MENGIKMRQEKSIYDKIMIFFAFGLQDFRFIWYKHVSLSSNRHEFGWNCDI